MAYKSRYTVTVTLTPGNGYEDSLPPSKRVMHSAIRRAIRESLHGGGYIVGKVGMIKPDAAPTARGEGRAGKGKNT